MVFIGVFAAGYAVSALPNTVAGWVCGMCAAFLVGVVGVRLLDRACDADEGEQDE